MTGTYLLTVEAQDKLKAAFNWGAIKTLFSVYAIFIILMLFRQPDLWVMGTFTLIILFIAAIVWFIRLLMPFALSNTAISITDHEIIRKGEGLLTVRIKYSAIRDIKEKSYGLIVIDDSFFTTVNYYFSKYRLTSESGIIFIPAEIEQYDRIKIFLASKQKEHATSLV
ncbi:hypothetical protein [Cesiribacter sp. SM1]|uniref:hypothetical protein n=1 Tax=Cesiribacter sp. SM1 TaxID=2861196 RepID=UPI001CD624D4|nr:hypothetical protein [Cesiribacter sp. SM1]